MSKYMCGPWEYGRRKDGSMWMSFGDPVNGPHSQFDWNGREEDAKLIVISPKMVEACKKIYEWGNENAGDLPLEFMNLLSDIINEVDSI